LKKAGLEGEKSLKGMEYGEKAIKDEVLLTDLVRVANELNNPNISTSDYNKYGKYTAVTMGARFGSWNKAKKKANLEITRVINNTNEELFRISLICGHCLADNQSMARQLAQILNSTVQLIPEGLVHGELL